MISEWQEGYAMTCDYNKALSGGPPFSVTMNPGDTKVESWDFSGCIDGMGRQLRITSVNFSLSYKNNKFLTVTAALNGVDQPILNNHVVMSDVTGKIFRLMFWLGSKAKQPVFVSISYSCNVGG